MKKLAFLTLLAIAAALSSCGSNQIQELPTSNISGNWEAQLTGGTGPAASLNFLVNFNLFVTNGSPVQNVNTNGFTFINANSCFPGAPAGVVVQTQLTNNISINQISGMITLTIKSSTGNVLNMSANPNVTPPTGELIGTSGGNNGTVTNGGVNGEWWLTPGSGASNAACTAGSETSPLPFIMCQNATSCTTAIGPSISPARF